MTAVLEADALYRFYHAPDSEVVALHAVSMRVDAGEVVVVVGPSGSGKSTLLACLSGLDEPDGGTVRVLGRTLTRRPEAERARQRGLHIGILRQHGNLVDHLTVAGNVEAAQRIVGGRDRRHGDDVLRRLGLSDRARARPGTLSGGEAARAGLAVALANDPVILLADEPTGELDATTGANVVGLLRDCADRGAAVVIATHAGAVADVADRVVTMYDGRIVE